MASTIRVRATANGDTTEVQALIQHPMDSGFVKDAKGEMIPPHFIQQLTFEYNGKTVFLADWGTGGLQGPLREVQLQGRQPRATTSRSAGSTTRARPTRPRRRSGDMRVRATLALRCGRARVCALASITACRPIAADRRD